MLFSDITILDDTFTPRYHRYVGVRDGKIAYIGTTAPMEDYGEEYPGAGRLLMPGMVNAHSHMPMTLLRGYGENMALSDWLNKLIFPFEAKMTGEDIYWATQLALAEMMRFGTVSATEMYYHGAEMSRAVLLSGMKASLSVGTMCFDDSELRDLPIDAEAQSVFREYHMAGDGRVRIDLSLHAEYTSTPRVAAALADRAKELGARMHVHVAETRSEQEECIARHGKTPVKYLCDMGLFDVPTTAAHCVWVTEEDREILKAKGVTVASCPVSNLKLASGIAPADGMIKQGINVALGTDGVSSNNDHDMFQDMKLFSILQKYNTFDPTAVSPREALYAATRAGALSQGRADCGLIREGFRADLIVLNLDAPHLTPIHDLCNTVVYSATGHDVCLTMADGKVLYRDGAYLTLDLERIYAEVNRRKDRILTELKA